MAVKWSQAWVEERKADFQSMREKIVTYNLEALRSFLRENYETGEAQKLNPTRTRKCARDLVDRLEGEFNQTVAFRKQQMMEKRGQARAASADAVTADVQEEEPAGQQPIVLFATEDEVRVLRERLDKVEGELGQLKEWEAKPLLVQVGGGVETPFTEWTDGVREAMKEVAQLKASLAKIEEKLSAQGDERLVKAGELAETLKSFTTEAGVITLVREQTKEGMDALRVRMTEVEGAAAAQVEVNMELQKYSEIVSRAVNVLEALSPYVVNPDQMIERIKALLKAMDVEKKPWTKILLDPKYWTSEGIEDYKLQEAMRLLREPVVVVSPMMPQVKSEVSGVKGASGQSKPDGSGESSGSKPAADLEIPAFLRR